MARVQLTLPTKFSFTTQIAVRITDVNYGNHLGNDSLLSILHEARLQYLQQLGYTEMNVGGAGLIMTDAIILFKAEAFYGELLTIGVAAQDFTRVGFNLYYRVMRNAEQTVVAEAKTGMVCYNYELKKVVSIPPEAKEKLQQPLTKD